VRELPSHLVILGGGYIACELGQMFRRFGADVTLIERGEHLLSREDPEISASIETVFRQEGIRLELGARVEEVSRARDQIVVGGREVRGSHLLVAAGRTPNTADLGCEAGGIAFDPNGFIVVDDRYRTSASGVYAVGDVTPRGRSRSTRPPESWRCSSTRRPSASWARGWWAPRPAS